MLLEQLLTKVAVIGAAGKMGRGIALLLLQQMASLAAKTASNNYRLYLIDTNEIALFELKHYFQSELTRYAEKKINQLRRLYVDHPDLVSNSEIITAFVNNALQIIQLSTALIDSQHASLIFEAIAEDLSIKVAVLKACREVNRSDSYYFSNTSAIPIGILSHQAGLNDRLVGLHFYNPPAIQKLVEVVFLEDSASTIRQLTQELATLLEKKVVFSNDIPGFIGNGYLIREVITAFQMAKKLAKNKNIPLEQAIYLVNVVTQKLLIRPMGIFQLIDYVGIDICKNISNIMRTYLRDDQLHDELLEKMCEANRLGGQDQDGSQKDGFFHYQHHEINKVFSLQTNSYQPVLSATDVEAMLGGLPSEIPQWKMGKHQLQPYFKSLLQLDSLGAVAAKDFLFNLEQIGNTLLEQNVVEDIDSFDTVLKEGFHHLYGVAEIKSWIK